MEARSEETAPGEEGPRRPAPPPRVSNKMGLNSFSWNLRYPDASMFQNLDHVGRRYAGPDSGAGNLFGSNRQLVVDRKRKNSDARQRSTFYGIARFARGTVRVPSSGRAQDESGERCGSTHPQRQKAQLADRAAKMPAAQRAEFKTKADIYSKPALIDRDGALPGEEPIRTGHPAQLSNSGSITRLRRWPESPAARTRGPPSRRAQCFAFCFLPSSTTSSLV